MKLSERLTAVANLVPPNTTLADIGADHGVLSYYLLEKTILSTIIISDISRNALNRSELLFKDTPLISKVQFRLGSGFAVLKPHEVDYAILAGMGGQTIINILEESPKITSSLTGLIIQAMGSSKDVRRYLMTHNFTIKAEEMIQEGKRFYTIIKAEKGTMQLSEAEIYAGPILIKENNPTLQVYLKQQIAYRQNMLMELVTNNQGKRQHAILKKEIAFIEKIQEGIK